MNTRVLLSLLASSLALVTQAQYKVNYHYATYGGSTTFPSQTNMVLAPNCKSEHKANYYVDMSGPYASGLMRWEASAAAIKGYYATGDYELLASEVELHYEIEWAPGNGTPPPAGPFVVEISRAHRQNIWGEHYTSFAGGVTNARGETYGPWVGGSSWLSTGWLYRLNPGAAWWDSIWLPTSGFLTNVVPKTDLVLGFVQDPDGKYRRRFSVRVYNGTNYAECNSRAYVYAAGTTNPNAGGGIDVSTGFISDWRFQLTKFNGVTPTL